MSSGLPLTSMFPWHALFSKLKLDGEVPCRSLTAMYNHPLNVTTTSFATLLQWIHAIWPQQNLYYVESASSPMEHPNSGRVPGSFAQSPHTWLPHSSFLSLWVSYPLPSNPAPSQLNAWVPAFTVYPVKFGCSVCMHIFAEIVLNAKIHFPAL